MNWPARGLELSSLGSSRLPSLSWSCLLWSTSSSLLYMLYHLYSSSILSLWRYHALYMNLYDLVELGDIIHHFACLASAFQFTCLLKQCIVTQLKHSSSWGFGPYMTWHSVTIVSTKHSTLKYDFYLTILHLLLGNSTWMIANSWICYKGWEF